MLYEKIPNTPQSNFTIPPPSKDSHASDGMIGTASTHYPTTSNPEPSSEIHAESSDKGKSDKQPESKKKGKSKKNKTYTPQEISFDQSNGNQKSHYPCIICNK